MAILKICLVNFLNFNTFLYEFQITDLFSIFVGYYTSTITQRPQTELSELLFKISKVKNRECHLTIKLVCFVNIISNMQSTQKVLE